MYPQTCYKTKQKPQNIVGFVIISKDGVESLDQTGGDKMVGPAFANALGNN